jgi:hypothetical protein
MVVLLDLVTEHYQQASRHPTIHRSGFEWTTFIVQSVLFKSWGVKQIKSTKNLQEQSCVNAKTTREYPSVLSNHRSGAVATIAILLLL